MVLLTLTEPVSILIFHLCIIEFDLLESEQCSPIHTISILEIKEQHLKKKEALKYKLQIIIKLHRKMKEIN